MSSTPEPAKMTRKERETARYRREILDVAVGLFAERSYAETTMQMIADAAEFSVGYLYKHFSGKEEMFRAMVDHHIAVMDKVIESIEAKGLAPLEELRETYEAVCAHFNHHRDFMRLYYQNTGASAPQMEQRKAEHFELMIKTFDAAITAGELKDVDPRMLAAAVQGASEMLFRELSKSDNPLPFAQMTDLLFRLLIDPQKI